MDVTRALSAQIICRGFCEGNGRLIFFWSIHNRQMCHCAYIMNGIESCLTTRFWSAELMRMYGFQGSLDRLIPG